ncbi:hypothetical protein EV356DRAFT_158239 [Viridothelium virens]|uniref:FHA domain-containing protein n=1 Tax=Viridothelium virens TaxID=1048519 RepID=A0A6A6H8K9_VIRVR|nr:hypothetical protein EV356DRAFT_158239 [Viridothelium virens]
MSDSISVRLDASSSQEAIATRDLNIIYGSRIPIGRASSCESKGLVANRNNAYFNCPVVSRTHAELFVKLENGRPSLYISDLNSMHGTYVNGVKLDKNCHSKLSDGDVLRIGSEVQRDEHHFRPLKYTVRLSPGIKTHQASSTDKNSNVEVRSFEVPDSTDDEYDSNGCDDNGIAIPTSQQDRPAHVLSQKDTYSNDVSGAKLNESLDHHEKIYSEASASPADSVMDDDVYSQWDRSSSIDEEEGPEEDPTRDDAPQEYLKPSASFEKQASIAASQGQESDTHGKTMPGYPSTDLGGISHTPTALWENWSCSSRMPMIPSMQTYPDPGSTSRNSIYSKVQNGNILKPIPYPASSSEAISHMADGSFCTPGFRLSDPFGLATTAPQDQSPYSQVLGLDSDASFSATPYQANRFAHGLSAFHQWKSTPSFYRSDSDKQSKDLPSKQTLHSELPFCPSNTAQSLKESPKSPELIEEPPLEDVKQLGGNTHHSASNKESKSALRICDLVDSLGTKESRSTNSAIGTKRKSCADTDSRNSSRPTSPSTTHPQAVSAKEVRKPVINSAKDELAAESPLSPGEVSENDLKAMEIMDAFDDGDAVPTLQYSEETEKSAVKQSDPIKQSVGTQYPSNQASSAGNVEQTLPKSEETIRVPVQSTQSIAQNQEEPPKKKIKLDAETPRIIERVQPKKSRLAAVTSAAAWAAVGSVATLTALANLPDTFFQ